jgi:hypothetical protein
LKQVRDQQDDMSEEELSEEEFKAAPSSGDEDDLVQPEDAAQQGEIFAGNDTEYESHLVCEYMFRF